MLAQQIEIKGSQYRSFIFDSSEDLIAEGSKVLHRTEGKQGAVLNSRELPMNSDFIGRRFYSMKEAVRASQTVWQEGLDAYSKMIAELREEHLPEPTSIRRRASWSEEDGDEVSLDRLRAGQAYWRTTHRDHRPGPVNVTIVAQSGGSCMYDSMDILWRGAAAVVLTELLEAAGYRVELWSARMLHRAATSATSRGIDKLAIAVNLKRSHDPLDVSSLVNISSGWYFRTLLMMPYWLTPGVEPKLPGYGAPQSDISALVPHITPDETAIVCQEIWGHNAAVNWIKEQLAKMI